MTLAEEIREAFANIQRRYEGNSMAAVKIDVIEKASAHIEELEDHRARCTCSASDPGFQLNTLSSRPVDAFFLLPKLRKFAAEEAEFAKRRGALDAGGRS